MSSITRRRTVKHHLNVDTERTGLVLEDFPEQGVELVVIKELLGHAHAGVYAHVRLRLQRHAIDTLGNALAQGDDAPDDPPTAVVVR